MDKSVEPVSDRSVKAVLAGNARQWETIVEILTDEVLSLRKQTGLLAGALAKLKSCSGRMENCGQRPGGEACIECWSLHAEEQVKEADRRQAAKAEAVKWADEFAKAGMTIKWDFDEPGAEGASR